MLPSPAPAKPGRLALSSWAGGSPSSPPFGFSNGLSSLHLPSLLQNQDMEKVETRSEFANLYLSSASLPLDALMPYSRRIGTAIWGPRALCTVSCERLCTVSYSGVTATPWNWRRQQAPCYRCRNWGSPRWGSLPNGPQQEAHPKPSRTATPMTLSPHPSSSPLPKLCCKCIYSRASKEKYNVSYTYNLRISTFEVIFLVKKK